MPAINPVEQITINVVAYPGGNVDRQEHCRISQPLATLLGVQAGQQIRAGYRNDDGTQEGESAVFTVEQIFAVTPNEVQRQIRIFPNQSNSTNNGENRNGGVFRLWGITGLLNGNQPTELASAWRFAPSRTITNGLTDTHYDEPAIQADPDLPGTKRFIEKVTTGAAAHRLAILVPHGGGIDVNTDDQVADFTAQLSSVDPTIWECEGQWGENATEHRWHITSNDTHRESFPGLDAILDQAPFQAGAPFQYVLSLHGFTGSFKGIVIGGRATMADKRIVRDQIKLAIGPTKTAEVALYVGDIPNGVGEVDPDGASWPANFNFNDKKGVPPRSPT